MALDGGRRSENPKKELSFSKSKPYVSLSPNTHLVFPKTILRALDIGLFLSTKKNQKRHLCLLAFFGWLSRAFRRLGFVVSILRGRSFVFVGFESMLRVSGVIVLLLCDFRWESLCFFGRPSSSMRVQPWIRVCSRYL